MPRVYAKGPAKGRFVKGQVTNPNGAPRKLVPASQLPNITRLAARGVRERDIARAMGMSQPTWIKCKHDFPEVLKALEDGQQQMHDGLVAQLLTRAKKGDVVPALFLLKTRYGYREGEELSNARPQVVINLPGSLPSETFKGLTIDGQPITEARTLLTKRSERG
jgi:hypothetical protein